MKTASRIAELFESHVRDHTQALKASFSSEQVEILEKIAREILKAFNTTRRHRESLSDPIS